MMDDDEFKAICKESIHNYLLTIAVIAHFFFGLHFADLSDPADLALVCYPVHVCT